MEKNPILTRSRDLRLSMFPIRKKVYKTNVLEDDLEELKYGSGEVEIELRPFEVATYRLQL